MVKIELKKVNKTFKPNVQVLKEIDLTIKDKEFMVLVGPSGCGKSTCLNLIAGLELVTDGEIIFDEIKVSELPPKERKIAMVFQSYALYPHMDVKKNMSFALRLAKMDQSTIDQRVQNAAEILNISQLLDRKPKELSGGQRQRVALGRCIVRNPSVFLFDEPLSNLDAKLRTEMRAEIIKLQKRLETTLVYVTHDQVEAMSMADKITILNAGRIQQVGTPNEVYNFPRNQFVAGFIGSPTMNFIHCEVNAGLIFGENKFKLPESHLERINQGTRKSVILGIRPEHIKITPEPRDSSYEVLISVLEYLGAETVISFTFKGDIAATVIAPGFYGSKMGDTGYVSFSLEKIHLFDESTGINLIHDIPIQKIESKES